MKEKSSMSTGLETRTESPPGSSEDLGTGSDPAHFTKAGICSPGSFWNQHLSPELWLVVLAACCHSKSGSKITQASTHFDAKIHL